MHGPSIQSINVSQILPRTSMGKGEALHHSSRLALVYAALDDIVERCYKPWGEDKNLYRSL